MEASERGMILVLSFCLIAVCAYVFWRKYWFFRNPARKIPERGGIVSPADGTVVYVERKAPGEPVISIKRQRRISISDIVREDMEGEKLLIGIFMSPFDVHYNRSPFSGTVEFIHHHPAKGRNCPMSSMHWRSLMKRLPIHGNSPHVIENERTVTRLTGLFKGESLSCYLVQIAGTSVRGIESCVSEGHQVGRGEVFGMIRIGSQVDLVLPWRESMTVRAQPGEKVRAGETILVE